ncbi:MAG TPA: ATP-binding cassette domain-containing protein [Candidatus Limnocylindrales bacterium]|nr:ATP-binding cassette domain-containing protein [Candidatus Limnocylindrales bacterium]
MSSESEAGATARGAGKDARRAQGGGAQPPSEGGGAPAPGNHDGCLLAPAEKVRSGVPADDNAHITVRDLTLAYGDFVVMRDLDFVVWRSDVFIIMGASGGGKSTLLRALLGLLPPARGEIWYGKKNFTDADPEARDQILRRVGVLYQTGGLWSSMTLAENVALPLGEFTDLTPSQQREVAALKLALVGLAGFEDYYPSQISGGMQKRAGLARAMALDPEILFFDEPSAGLDPISSRLLDELILELRESLKTTIVVVSHDLPSIFTIANNGIFLDVDTRTIIASGNPNELVERCRDPKVHRFLTRSGSTDEVGNVEGRHV